MSTQKLKIIADGSVIAIANAKKYNETLKNQTNWTWKQVNEFLLDTNKDNLIVFQTAWEDEWVFKFLINEKTDKPSFRQFEQSIEVTDERLYLANWTDLTSSLQFENTIIPDKTNENLQIKINNGFYKVIVKQLFDQDNYDYDGEDKVNYIVELMYEPDNPDIRTEKIIWSENFPNDNANFLNNKPNEFDDFLNQLLKDK
ncbi:hypothetical protein QFZ37_003198 [Chryseobacterium ginsenosidimutans]|uniref:hypothetical protein n=1 Tax=Chryseobacterium ginsenosidimutans TaxID=687846 RepID=UPI002786C2DA|nr:hypothetical protein [Chryseobacterium ginsenosidimutans]MDQ0594829.1 hypothetical protein [Chryseobacterium ginsenosidimutans]